MKIRVILILSLLLSYISSYSQNCSVEFLNFDFSGKSNGQRGIEMRVKIKANGYKDHFIRPVAFFYDNQQNPLTGIDVDFMTSDTKKACASGKNSNVIYEDCLWKQFPIFVPYKALNRTSKNNLYYMKVSILLDNKKYIANTDYIPFTIYENVNIEKQYNEEFNITWYKIADTQKAGVNRYGALDENGRLVIPTEYKSISMYDDGLFTAFYEYATGRQHESLFSIKGECIIHHSNGYYFKTRHAWTDGKKDYTFVNCLKDNWVMVYYPGEQPKFGAVDIKTGKLIIPLQYSKIKYNRNSGRFEVAESPKGKLYQSNYTLDNNGHPIVIPEQSKIINPDFIKYQNGYKSVEMVKMGSTYFYKIYNGVHYGLSDSYNKIVIPFKFDRIDIYGKDKFKVKDKYGYGIYLSSGKNLIPTSRGYTYINDYVSGLNTIKFKKNNFEGECDIQGNEVSYSKIPLTAEDIKKLGYTTASLVKQGNINYFIVSKNNKYGLTDAEGKEIILCEMETIRQCGSGYVKFKIGNSWGVKDYKGNTIIPTERGYTSIGDYVSSEKRFPYTMPGYKGECNNQGVQISKIKIETPTPNIAKQTTSSKKEEPKEESLPPGLLYKGEYTQGQGYCLQTGEWTESLNIPINIEIYENYLIAYGTERHNFRRIDGGNRVYGNNNNWEYHVDANYNVTLITEASMSLPFGPIITTIRYNLSKGDSHMPVHYNMNNNGYGNSNTGSNNTYNSRSNRNQEQTPRKERVTCRTCDGNKTIVKNGSGVNFGTAKFKKRCSVCGYEYWNTSTHSHESCPTCHGRGYIEY